MSVVDGVVDEDDNIYRFFLELTATYGLSWTVFLADLGYNSKELLKLPGNLRDMFFFQYLLHWLETVTRLGFNPIEFMYRALIKTQDKDLINKFKRQIQSDTLDLPSDQEFEIIKGNLFEIDISNQNIKACIKGRKEQIMYVERDIWSNLTHHELTEIKALLRQTKKDQFPKTKLEEIETGVDLMRKLHETCLITEDDFSYLKSILHFLKRDDLIVKITALESPGFVFQKESLPVKQIVLQCISTDHALRNSNHKPLEDLYLKFFHSTRIIENNISAKTKEILQTDCRTKELTTTSESCRQKMKKCAKERIQIEAQIKKLHSDANDLQSKETSLRQELSSLDVEIKKEKELHQQQTSELDLYKSALEKESAILEELERKKRRHALEIENIKQSQQKEEIQNRISRAIEISHYPLIEKDCPGDDEDKTAKMVSRYESHISRDESKQKEVEAAQCASSEEAEARPPKMVSRYESNISREENKQKEVEAAQCASSEEAEARPLSLEVNVDPMILVMAAEENKDELESFKADVLLAVPQSVTRSSIQEIVIESFIDEQFLSKTDKQIQKAVLLLILVSGGFEKRCWPDISKMKTLIAALYDQQPLVVPVIIKANVKPPIGLNSAHSLSFYRRDSHYKEALSKLLGQLKK
ncbi:uncharacterized protein [Mytilus edulis]|uniref:uncharacterized protein isoform X2 n=1 Tax=Mytilus edulis TaxID=6550 RepID=UPI0039EE3EA6